MTIKDAFSNYASDRSAPPPAHIAVTPSDSADLEFMTSSLYIGGAGNVAVLSKDGDSVTYVSNGGGYIVGQFKRVLSTGTTATNIIAVGWRA
jgi:hypothetical protein